MMPWICAAVIIPTMGEMGLLLKNKLSARRKELKNLIYALTLLKTDLSYAEGFLGDVFENIGKRVDGIIGELFFEAGNELRKSSDSNGLAVILNKRKNELSLSAEDCKILENLGKELGTRDLESELRRLDYAVKTTEIALLCAEEKYNKWGRVYGLGGWLCGLMTALFFL